MCNKRFWQLIGLGLGLFMAFCLLSWALAPELALLVLLAYVGSTILAKLDDLDERLG